MGEPSSASPAGARPRRRRILREVLDPPPWAPAELYWRLSGPEGARAGARLPLDLAAGETLSLDTWSNHFPLPFRQAHGGDGAVFFEPALEGRAEIRLLSQAPDAPPRLLLTQQIEGAADLPDPALPVPEAAEGRLWAEIEALSPTRLLSAAWTTEAPPTCAVRLSLGLCAFGREAELQATLEEILPLARSHPAIARIFLVNQGAPFASAALRALAADPLITPIAQPNLGGCGGFARTLAEAAEDPSLTHHLLMDDDIRLDGRMLTRAIQTLQDLPGAPALGGGMLDLRAPECVHEAGASLARFGVVKPYAKGVDLTSAEGLAPFARDPGTDFNGWWFFAVPLSVARRVGLPPPIFLRGDDLDYALRLAEAGSPTLTPPGLSVWHEPFYAKATSWQHYYDLRNRLIAAAAHPDRVEPVRPIDLLERLLTPALSQDYATAEWRLRAVGDFLGGPDRLFARPPQEIHAQVSGLAPDLRPERLESGPQGVPEIAEGPPPGDFSKALGFLIAALALLGPLSPRPFARVHDRAALPGLVRGRAHARMDPGGHWFQLHRPRRGAAFSQSLRGIALTLRYALGRRRALRDWAKGLDRHRAPEAWAALFRGRP